MRIVLTSPTTWPLVRRGGERFLNELAAYMASRGHQTVILSSKPGAKDVTSERGYRTIRYRRFWHPVLAKIGLLEFHAFFLKLLPALVLRRCDVILCANFVDAFAAILARPFTGAPCVFFVNSPPPPVQYFRSLTLRGAVLRRVMRDVDEVHAISDFMKDFLAHRYGRGGTRIYLPVDLNRFPVSRNRSHERPAILCAAALDDERKGGKVLFRAFDLLKTRRPEALLRISGPVSDETRASLLELVRERWRTDVEFLGQCPLEELPALYGGAAVSVLPSLWEAFGLVVVESLACGTPVVATRDGALPEIINHAAVGRLFDPGPLDGAAASNAEGLAAAMLECLELSKSPITAERCRERAEAFSWDRLGPEYERLFERLANPRIEQAQRKEVRNALS